MRAPFPTPILFAAVLGLGLGLSACGRGDDRGADATTEAEAGANAATSVMPTVIALKGGDGAVMGELAVSEDPTGVTLRIAATGLTAGAHGVHLHSVGACDGPKFESAGPHWNPTDKKHGRDNPAGAHSGDLANLMVGADGKGSSVLLVGGTTMGAGAGATSLADADGSALVIHAKPDDYKTDPSGDSGDRVACAVVTAAG